MAAIGTALVLSAATAFIGTTPAHAARNEPSGVKNLFNGLCWAVAGGSKADNAQLVQYTCDPQRPPSQQFEWYYDPASPNAYVEIHITNDAYWVGYSCVAVAGGSTASLAKIVQYHCDGEDRSLWQVLYVANTGTYQVKNKHSGLCITQNGLSTKINAPLVQYTCDGQNARRWYDY